MPGQPTTPIIIQLPDGPTPESGVADVFLQAVGVTGAFIVGTIVAGLAIGVLLIWFRKLRSVGPDEGVQRLGL